MLHAHPPEFRSQRGLVADCERSDMAQGIAGFRRGVHGGDSGQRHSRHDRTAAATGLCGRGAGYITEVWQ